MSMPSWETTGVRAERTACRYSTRRSEMPLDLAVRM